MSNINFDVLDNLDFSPQLLQQKSPKKSPPPPPTNLLQKIDSTPNPDDNIQILLDKQGEKLQLRNELNLLIKKRSNLRTSIDEAVDRIAQLKASHLKKIVDDKLDQMLEESNEQYIKSHTKRKAESSTLKPPSSSHSARSTPQSSNDSLLQDLNVLPSSDWDERLDYVKKFYPYLDVERVSTANSYVDAENMVRTISYTVVCPLIFQVGVSVHINPKLDSIDRIVIHEKQLATLHLISPSYYQVLTKNYISHGKIDLVMYSLNSLSIVVHKRVSLFFKLLKMFSSFVEDETLFKLTTEETTSNLKVFSNLKSVENIDFVFENNNESYKVKLYWSIILDDVITGECLSSINLLIIRQSDAKILNNVRNLFTALVKEYGLINGFCLLTKKTFGITID